jgi:cyanophycinase
LWALLCSSAAAQDFFERYDDWPERTTIRGTVVVAPSVATLEQNVQSVRELVADRDVTVRSNDGPVSDQTLEAFDEFAERADISSLSTVEVDASSFAKSDLVFLVSDSVDTVFRSRLLPDCLVQTVPAEAEGSAEAQREWWARLRRHPRRVGVQLTADSLLVLSGRLLGVIGPGSARLSLSETVDTGPRTQVLQMRRPRAPVSAWLADLTQWRRRALETTLEPFPPADRQVPKVDSGSLLIVGGGGMPKGLMDRFIELAGGVEAARLVFIPCSQEEELPENSLVRRWRRMGVKHAHQLHTKDRRRAHTDEEFLAPLRAATGLWFGGGRQWNFADSYYGTEAHRLMKEVLVRGGVIGGSSAGASIQASYLARATPIGNTEIMAPGYERGGLGFITGVAIDQHFSQRDRHPDLKALVTQYPQLLGIGIDEATAIEVTGSRATVLGAGRVFFDQWIEPASNHGASAQEGEVQVTALAADEVYDLGRRAVVQPEN